VARAAFDRGAKVKRWERKLDNPKPALKQIGVMMTAESQQAFKAQRFGKKKWKERAKVNVYGIIADFAMGRKAPPNRRFKSKPALRDTGRLAASIAHKVVGKDTVEVGSNLPYAGKHHRGTETESKKITPKVQELLWAWLKTKGTDLKRKLGWLLNKKFTNTTLKMDLPERPIVGITKQTIKDVQEAVGVKIMEAK